MNYLTLNIKDEVFNFETLGGVFSAREIDPGTKLLADHICSSEISPGRGGRNKILDLGCGYGVLGIAAAKFYPEAYVELRDDSLRATKMATRNVEINQVRNAKVVLGDGFSDLEGKFDLILSNLPLGYGNELVEELVEDSAKHLALHGQMWIVTQNRFKPFIKRVCSKYFKVFDVKARGGQHFVAEVSGK